MLRVGYIYSVADIDALVGKWKSDISGKLWDCIRISSTQLSCDGNKVTFFGSTLTWETTGAYGTYDDNQNTVNWRSGKWIKEGRTNTMQYCSLL